MRRISLALVALASLAASGCSPRYYAPNTHNVPQLTRAGDFSGAFTFGASRGELQGAYAFTPNVAAMINAAAFDQADDEQGDGGQGGILELGLGYTTPFADRFHFSVFGLVGGGNVENHFPSTLASNPGTTGILEAKLARYGVQPSIGFRSTYFEAIGSVRVLGLRYSDVSGSLVFANEDQVQSLRSQTSHTLLEPAITLRGGFETWKLQLQLGWSKNKGHSNFRQEDGYLTAGVVYSPR
jgi:hypothetical protein